MKTKLTQAIIDQLLVDSLNQTAESFSESRKKWGSLTPEQRKSTKGLGEETYKRCNMILNMLRQNPEVTPRDFDGAEVQQWIAYYDQMKYCREVFDQFNRQLDDVIVEFGAHIKTTCYDAFSVAKRTGKNKGIDIPMKQISKQFSSGSQSSPSLQTPEAITAATQKSIQKATQKAVDEAAKKAIELATEQAVKSASEQAVNQVNKVASQHIQAKNAEIESLLSPPPPETPNK